MNSCLCIRTYFSLMSLAVSLSFYRRNIKKYTTMIAYIPIEVIVNCKNVSKFVRLTEPISMAMVKETAFFRNSVRVKFIQDFSLIHFFPCLYILFLSFHGVSFNISFNQRNKIWTFKDMCVYFMYGNVIKYS